MEKALEQNKTLEKLTLSAVDATLPREFCRHVLLGSRQIPSLSAMELNFNSNSWDCPDDGRLVSVSQITCCVSQLDVVYSV